MLVIDHENISRIKEFNINDYTVSLYSNGYSYHGRGNLHADVAPIDKRLNLQSISNELKSIQYINNLFKNEIPKEREPFARFHTYYQIIEILISIVFEDKFKQFVEELQSDVESLFEKRERLGELTLEKKRIVWLFSEYVKVDVNALDNLEVYCKRLLKKNNNRVGKNTAENLYLVRCLLVHNMYMFDDESYILLEDIDGAFLDVLIKMLLSFHIE